MFNKKTTLEEILNTKNGKKILANHGVPCLSCPFASQEARFLKLEEIGKKYELEIEKIIDDLNNDK